MWHANARARVECQIKWQIDKRKHAELTHLRVRLGKKKKKQKQRSRNRIMMLGCLPALSWLPQGGCFHIRVCHGSSCYCANAATAAHASSCIKCALIIFHFSLRTFPIAYRKVLQMSVYVSRMEALIDFTHIRSVPFCFVFKCIRANL